MAGKFLSKTDAAYEILSQAGHPMTYSEIIEVALKKKMIKVSGKTPQDTLRVDIRNEIARGVKKRFKPLKGYKVTLES